MSELAFNYKGQRFAPPGRAVYWSVRRIRDGQRGQLDVVRDPHGLPLIVPINVSISGFREAVSDQHGRYRLDALDEDKMQIDGAEPAYVSVPQPVIRKVIEVDAAEPGIDHEVEDVDVHARIAAPAAGLRNSGNSSAVTAPLGTVTAPFGTWPALPAPLAMSGVEYLLAEAMRGQVQTQIEQMRHLTTMMSATLAAQTNALNANAAGAAQMMSAAAELLRAADGAAMPRRDPPPPPPAPVPPASPPPSPPPAPPTVVYAIPRNAAFADDDYDEDDEDGDGVERDGDEEAAEPAAEDFFTKANKLVATVGKAIAPVAEVAKLVMGAGIGGLGGMFGSDGGEAPRNATEPAPTAAAPATEAEPALGHLRVSHVLAVSHELGAKDGSTFRNMIRAMEPDDRRMFIDRLCELALEDAVTFAAEQVAWLKARIVRSQRSEPDLAHDDASAGADDADLVTDSDHDDGNPDREFDTTQQDDTDTDSDQDDCIPEAEDDTNPHDNAHADALDDQEPDDDLDDDAPTGNPGPTAARVADVATATAPEVPRPLSPDVAAHMKLIAKYLTFGEIMRGQALVNQTSVRERNAWIERLMALAPADAAAVLRAELARRAGA